MSTDNKILIEKLEINRLKNELKLLEDEIKVQKDELKEQKNLLRREQEELQQDQKEIVRINEDLSLKEKRLYDREKELTDRELNALIGFQKQNSLAQSQHLKKIEEIDIILSKRNEEISRLEQQKLNKIHQIDQEVENYRAVQLTKVNQTLEAVKQGRLEQYEKEKVNYFKDIEEQKEMLEVQRLRLEEREKHVLAFEKELIKKEELLKEKENELEQRQRQIELDRRFYERDYKLLEQTIQKHVEDQLAVERSHFESKDRLLSQLKQKLSSVEQDLRRYEMSEIEQMGRSTTEVLAELAKYKEEVKNLRQQLQLVPRQEMILELEEKAKLYDEVVREKEKVLRDYMKLEQQQSKYLMSVSQLQQESTRREIEERRRMAVEAQVEHYVREVNRLKSLYEPAKEKEVRIGVIEDPYFTKSPLLPQGIDEFTWLNAIYEQCLASGIRFNKRLLYSFHTALKTSEWSPLTVLAGVSGTGKSELPRLYSRFGGFYHLSLSVQPDWDSPQSLFGFFNSVDNRFNATSLLRAMIQFQDAKNEKMHENTLRDYMMIVLLDEMNLAHVELYFSELLSKLEMRRGESSDVTLDIDLGAGVEKYKVDLSRNILWTGTMNEDETTKSLSDKVLDRSNSISFPRPKSFERRLKLQLAEESPKLRRSTWNKWINDHAIFKDEDIKPYKEGLEEINQYLESVGRALGHRVWQSIENYMSNNPIVITSYGSDDQQDYMKKAFEEAVVYKVMPKLRGIETTGFSKINCLDKIEEVLRKIAPGLLEDYSIALKSPYGVFIWQSAKYLEDGNAYGE
jgi:hypothetical protein